MPIDPRLTLEHAARALVQTLAEQPAPPSLRVADVEGRVACLILVWDAAGPMPLAGAERRQRVFSGRVECKLDVMQALRSVGRPLIRKELLKALKQAGKNHGAGTVAKALADLTAAGELVNTRDKKGYRLPDWVRRRDTPGLFDTGTGLS